MFFEKDVFPFLYVITLVTGHHFKMAVFRHVRFHFCPYKNVLLFVSHCIYNSGATQWMVVPGVWSHGLTVYSLVWTREYRLVHNLANFFYHVCLLKI